MKVLLLGIMILTSINVQALTVVASQDAKDASIYYADFPKYDAIKNIKASDIQDNQYIPDMPFTPYKSDLTVGHVDSKDFETHLTQNFFIIGYDQQSLAWARKNAKALKKAHAIGLAANIKTKAQLKILEGILNMPLIVGDLTGFGNGEIDLKHYPVLITSKGVFQ